MTTPAILGIRHHSPACARQVEIALRELRPAVVLLEGPEDMQDLLPHLVAPETVPPVAFFAYKRDGSTQAFCDPFSSFSPEYAAVRVAHELQIPVRLFDLPARCSFREEEEQEATDPGTGFQELTDALAVHTGYATYHDFWEATVERTADPLSWRDFFTGMATLGEMVRSMETEADPADLHREAYMRTRLRAACAEYGAERVAVICGAAHVPALADLSQSAQEWDLPEDPNVVTTVIPYSFGRLCQYRGYGSGVPHPAFYALAWDCGADFDRAGTLVLTELARKLRKRGYAASTAQVIEARTLAHALAGMRNRPFPGAAELSEAAVACLGHGQSAIISPLLEQILVGETLGQIPPGVSRTSLQQDFYRQVQALGIPLADYPRDLTLSLAEPSERSKSILLHRIALAEIPFGTLSTGGLSGVGAERTTTMREKWQVYWTPHTDLRLIEQTAHGGTLEEVGVRVLERQMRDCTSITQATTLLFTAVESDFKGLLPAMLLRAVEVSTGEADFASLASSAFRVATLIRFELLPDSDALGGLLHTLYVRACLALVGAAAVTGETADKVREGIRNLCDLARAMAGLDSGLLFQALQGVFDREDAEPEIRGLTLIQLFIMGAVDRGELAQLLMRALAPGVEPTAGVGVIRGLLVGQTGYVVRNVELIGVIDAYLTNLPEHTLFAVLPILRASLASLSRAELSCLGQTLAQLWGIGTDEVLQNLSLPLSSREQLERLDQQVATMLVGWCEKYGLREGSADG